MTVMTEENIERVRVLVDDDQSLSIAEISQQTGLSTTIVWRILRKKLKLYPYKPHEVIPRSAENMEGRVDFCTWLMSELDSDSEFLQLVLFSDEKKFVEKVQPNRQNERYWAMSDPQVMEETRVQGGKSQMCWAGLIDGRIIVHWFDEKSKTEHRSTAQMVRDWLASKFGDQATRLTDPGPPDLLTSLPLISGSGMSVRSSSGGILPHPWLSLGPPSTVLPR